MKTYYNVGKLLIEAQGGEKHARYGNTLINDYARRLTLELGKGYTATNLRYMRQFYLFSRKHHAVRDKLTWTHYRVLMSLKDEREIQYYINLASQYNWSYRELN